MEGDRKRPNPSPSDSPVHKKAKKSGFSVITFHVALKDSDAERMLELGNHESFSCLAEGVIQAFSYDILRIYSFHLDGEAFSMAGPTYYSPIANRSPTSVDTLLSDVEWTVDQTFLLLYDYGECHNFIITVKQIQETEEPREMSVIFSESKGTPPEQAPDTSDDEFEHSSASESSEEILDTNCSEDEEFKPSK